MTRQRARGQKILQFCGNFSAIAHAEAQCEGAYYLLLHHLVLDAIHVENSEQ